MDTRAEGQAGEPAHIVAGRGDHPPEFSQATHLLLSGRGAKNPAVSGMVMFVQMHLCGRLGSIWLWQTCVRENGLILRCSHSTVTATEVTACF